MLLPVVHSAYGSSETCNKSSIFPTYSRQIPTENKHKTSEITEPLTGIKRLPVDSHTNTHGCGNKTIRVSDYWAVGTMAYP